MTFMSVTARNLSLRSHFGASRHASALSTFYFALFTDDPYIGGTEAGFSNGYARVPKANDATLWGTIGTTDDNVRTISDITWPTSTGMWVGQVFSYWGVMSASTGGVLWYASRLANTGITVQSSGVVARIPATAIVLRQDG